jgi:hypothetical protein
MALAFSTVAIGMTGLAAGAMLAGGPEAPDTSGADANAAEMVKLEKEQFEWAKGEYEKSAADRAATADRAIKVSDSQIKLMDSATALGEEYAAYNRGTFRPLEQSIVKDAMEYDTEDRREQAAGRASADVQQAYGAAAADSGRDMARMGINPADGAYGEMVGQRELGLALGKAGAENRARTQVETIGAARKMDAASLGRGLPSAQATQASLAITSGDSAVKNSVVSNQVTDAGTQTMNDAYGNAINGLNTSGNMYLNSSKVKASNQDDGGGLASLAGSAMTAYAI